MAEPSGGSRVHIAKQTSSERTTSPVTLGGQNGQPCKVSGCFKWSSFTRKAHRDGVRMTGLTGRRRLFELPRRRRLPRRPSANVPRATRGAANSHKYGLPIYVGMADSWVRV